VVRLVVEDDDAALATREVAQDPRRDGGGLLAEGVGLHAVAAAEQLARVCGYPLDLLRVAGKEGVVVDDLDLGFEQRLPQVRRDEVALAVVAVVALGVEHAEAVADRDPRRDDQEALGEARVGRRHHLVDRLPGDQHRHHHRLAGPGRHLQTHPGEARVVLGVDGLEPAPVIGAAVATGDLGEEDRGFGGLALAEEDGVIAVGTGDPVREQLAGVGGGAVPVVHPPALDLQPDVVDQRVLLEALAGGEVERLLLAGPLAGSWHGDERLAAPPPRLDLPGRPPLAELEMALGRVEGRVQNRV